MWYVWLILAGVFIIAEIATSGFLVFWLGLGSLCAMVSSFFIDDLLIQTIVFVISSTIFILSTRPLVKKLTKNDKSIITNAFAIVGKKAIVIKDINPQEGYGQIKVDGQVWSAKPEKDEIIPKGTNVIIMQIDGVKAVVSKDVNNSVVYDKPDKKIVWF